MSDVDTLHFHFPADGVFEGFGLDLDRASGSSWHFDIDENDLCGDAWSLVTWGTCNHDDPEFTTPFPELFTDEDEAVANAVKYAKDLMDSHGYKASEHDAIAKLVGEDLKANGQTRLSLDDGAYVHWTLCHFGVEIPNTNTEK